MWCDYDKATPQQQESFAHINRRRISRTNLCHYKIWIKPDGTPSLRKGHWEWTKKYADDVAVGARQFMSGEDVRTKGDLRDFKAGDLHLNRER